MTGKRFETGVHINVGTEGLVIQQTAGASSMPLQILNHDATPVFMVHTTGEVTAPMGVNVGAATKTEIEYLSGVTSSVQTQINNANAQISSANSSMIQKSRDDMIQFYMEVI